MLLLLLFLNRKERLNFCLQTVSNVFVIVKIAFTYIYMYIYVFLFIPVVARVFFPALFIIFLSPPSVVVLHSVSFPPYGSFSVIRFQRYARCLFYDPCCFHHNEIQRRFSISSNTLGEQRFSSPRNASLSLSLSPQEFLSA